MLVILFGPPGSGKTTLGTRVAESTGYDFYDMDQSMPASLRKKMSRGEIMSDEEREDYLSRVKQDLRLRLETNSVVAGCVLVRERHRRDFKDAFPNSLFVKLEAPADVLAKRVASRPGHFFNERGLRKMLSAEEPVELPHIVLDVTVPINQLTKAIETEIINHGGR